MISRLHVQNFQKHRSLELKLDPRITTIVGSSDVGKSALLRALRWILLSQPRGVGFIRRGAKRCIVTLRVDRKTLTRTKGVKNTYVLDGRHFKAIGTEVPKEIADLLNVSPLTFQQQHDAPFWFAESAGAVSKHLNAVVDLSEIDGTLGRLSSTLRSARGEETLLKDRVRQAVIEKRGLRWVVPCDRALRHLEVLKRKRDGLKERAELLSRTLQDLRRLKEEAGALAHAAGASRALRKLERLAQESARKSEERYMLERLVTEYQRLQNERADLDADYGSTLEELDGLMGEQCPLCGQEVKRA
jgi:exonuclease SbcC